MKNKFFNLFISVFTVTATLAGCSSEPVNTVSYNQYSVNQTPTYQQPVKNITPPAVKQQNKTTVVAKAPVKVATKTVTETKQDPKTEIKKAVSPVSDPSISVEKKIMLKAKQKYDGLKNFSATFTMFSKRNDKTNPKGNPLLTAETKYLFEAPRKSVFNVVKHSISAVAGAKMIWDGGDKVKVKAGGVLGLFPLELALTDSKMTTNRDWKLDQLDHVAALERALSPKATLKLAGKTTINGREVYMIKQTGNTIDGEVTEENIAIDSKEFYIVANEMYAGTDLVFQLKINVESVNINIPADAYEL